MEATTHLNAVREEDESSRPSSPAARSAYPDIEHLQRVPSTHTFGSSTPVPQALDVPTGVNSARNSLNTLITALDQELRMPALRPTSGPPLSASSEVTLFDPSAEGPQAESTPHESNRISSRPPSANIPPVPRIPAGMVASGSGMTSEQRRSSIIYIKSENNENASPPVAESTPHPRPTRSNSRRLAEWSSRAVRPLVPKSKDKTENAAAAVSPGGLRQLSLLQDRDINRGAGAETRPLVFGKGKKSARNDENAAPMNKKSASSGKGLRPLKLTRSETTKERAMLRQQEVLPDVVVRPPSITQNPHFGHGNF